MSPRAVKLGLVITAVAAVGCAAAAGPGHLAFASLGGVGDVAERLAPLLLIALFVERALEVFVSAWRAPEERVRRAARASDLGRATPEDEETLARYKGDTQRIAFVAGVTLGMIVSAIGIRALAPFVDAGQLSALTGGHRLAFTLVDVLITGALIGGGADGIHKFVKVFTTFLDATAAQNEARRPAVGNV